MTATMYLVNKPGFSALPPLAGLKVTYIDLHAKPLSASGIAEGKCSKCSIIDSRFCRLIFSFVFSRSSAAAAPALDVSVCQSPFRQLGCIVYNSYVIRGCYSLAMASFINYDTDLSRSRW